MAHSRRELPPLAFCVLVATCSAGAGGAQLQPDFSGNWVLVSPVDAAPNVAQTLTVEQSVEHRTSVRGVAVDFTHVTITSRSKAGTRFETYQIGLAGGTVTGVAADARSRGSSGEPTGTHFSTRWVGDRLVIETGTYSGSSRAAGVYGELKEVWSIDADGALVIVVEERPSGRESRTTTLRYRRQ